MKQVHVAVAVIVRVSPSGHKEILLSLRPDHVHQGGLWEFPGGKVETGEPVRDALARELDEELGIEINPVAGSDMHLNPLIKIQHDYGDKRVLLDVWWVSDFSGKPQGREGQEIKWVALDALNTYAFPEANRPIIIACQLPRRIAISPDISGIQLIKQALRDRSEAGVPLILLRLPLLRSQKPEHYEEVKDYALHMLSNNNSDSRLLLHDDLDEISLAHDSCAGVHLSSNFALTNQDGLNLPPRRFFGVSCHDLEQLHQAQNMGASYAFLSPVKASQTHPKLAGKGWEWFASLAQQAVIPVYALGGMGEDDLPTALLMGGQGIAAIRGLLASST